MALDLLLERLPSRRGFCKCIGEESEAEMATRVSWILYRVRKSDNDQIAMVLEELGESHIP